MKSPASSGLTRFYKADFHNHTPASTDFQDRNASPEDIIQAAEAKGIEILAITDHNSADWVDRLRKAADGRRLRIIPGVEITTPGGHILALFELDYDVGKIADILVALGIPRSEHGQETAMTKPPVEDVLRAVAAEGGLCIAAHANSDSGLLKNKGQYKLKLVPMPELAALEFTKQDDIDRFRTGTVSKDYRPKACTQSSDSHTLAEMGRRFTYLKLQHVSLRAVAQGLLDYEMRVRFPWDFKEATHPRIVRLSANQGFFEGQQFEFHENLNCLVGGKGTGKSTVIELLRFCFEDASSFENIHQDHEGKIDTLVGEGGTVVVEYLDGDGEMKTVSREVWRPPSEREVRDSAGNPAVIETPPFFFSQGELVQIASSPMAQLDLIDEALDIERENEQEKELIGALQKNSHEIVATQGRMVTLSDEFDHQETGKKATELQYRALDQKLKEPVLKSFPLWEAEQEYLSLLASSLADLPTHVAGVLADVALDDVNATAPTKSPNAKRLSALASIPERLAKALEAASMGFADAVSAMQKELKGVQNEIKPLYVKKKAEHKRVVQALGQADLRRATVRLENLSKRLTKLAQCEADLQKLKARKQKAEATRRTLLGKLVSCRQSRWKKRAEKALELGAKLEGVIRVSLLENGDRSHFAAKVKELSRQGLLQRGDIELIAQKLTPPELLDLVIEGDVKGIATKAGITDQVAKRLVDSFQGKDPKQLYELELVPLPDQPIVSYLVRPDREKILKELSTGQKGTVIISLAMVEGVGPLVIDQPEEPLDTESIYGKVVKTLRGSKEGRQFILTTHNPNIAVGADAELSHILDADADKGSIVSSGNVDSEETARLLLVHLEGGPDALDLRIKKYRR